MLAVPLLSIGSLTVGGGRVKIHGLAAEICWGNERGRVLQIPTDYCF